MPIFKRKKKQEKKIKAKSKENKPHEGQLAVDVYENEKEIIIVAPIANAKKEDIEIYIEQTTVAISGKRELPEEGKNAEKFLHQECYWGAFSREIVLPEEVDSHTTKALFENGIIKIKLPKMRATQRKKIVVSEKE